MRRKELSKKIWHLARKPYTKSGWNGRDAKPVEKMSRDIMVSVLARLPDGLLPSDIVAEPSGRVTAVWRWGNGNTLIGEAYDWDGVGFSDCGGIINGQKFTISRITFRRYKGYTELRYGGITIYTDEDERTSK